MNKQTRFKFGLLSFFSLLIVAILKHWLPGISDTIILSACVPIVTYMLGESFRPSYRDDNE